ncbi:MAG: hypothetical protein Q9167_000274 [Letrouitia subvulpina]
MRAALVFLFFSLRALFCAAAFFDGLGSGAGTLSTVGLGNGANTGWGTRWGFGSSGTGHTPLSARRSRLHRRAEGGINCRGSTGCSQLWEACPKSAERIKDDAVFQTGGRAEDTGVWARAGKLNPFGCGIFVQKKKKSGRKENCAIGGKELKEKFDKIREHGCKVCGNYDLGDGCEVVINYTLE